jgi:hypothetical protein
VFLCAFLRLFMCVSVPRCLFACPTCVFVCASLIFVYLGFLGVSVCPTCPGDSLCDFQVSVFIVRFIGDCTCASVCVFDVSVRLRTVPRPALASTFRVRGSLRGRVYFSLREGYFVSVSCRRSRILLFAFLFVFRGSRVCVSVISINRKLYMCVFVSWCLCVCVFIPGCLCVCVYELLSA